MHTLPYSLRSHVRIPPAVEKAVLVPPWALVIQPGSATTMQWATVPHKVCISHSFTRRGQDWRLLQSFHRYHWPCCCSICKHNHMLWLPHRGFKDFAELIHKHDKSRKQACRARTICTNGSLMQIQIASGRCHKMLWSRPSHADQDKPENSPSTPTPSTPVQGDNKTHPYTRSYHSCD